MAIFNYTPPPLFTFFWQHKKKSLIVGVLIALLISFYFALPNKLFSSPISSILMSREGHLLGAHISSDEQWRFPPLTTVPSKFKTALVAFEDKRFYHHIGIDPLAIARALKLNLSAGRVVSGGSTLSMQVIRLSSNNPKRTLWNKIIEAFKALRLETRYNKEQILALYASHAPFGGNVVGLEAASWRYFGRHPNQLSWAESAMLAVLPNSPALIHISRKRDRLLSKRNHLLLRLLSLKKLSQLDYQLAIAEPLPEKPKPLPRLAPHLLDTLVAQKGKQQRFQTTLDRNLQEKLNQVAKRQTDRLALAGIHNFAILIIDNHSFEVKAYIGNALSNKSDKNGQAIDMIQRPRSTGSTLKPFLFARMIDAGEITPETLIADTSIRYTGYQPRNYDRKFRGAVRAKQALASSLNIPAVNMLSYHGVEKFLATLKQMGMTTLHRSSREYGLPLILGGAEGSLWKLTNMYANLANRAQQPAQHINDYYHQAKVLISDDNQTTRHHEISPASAWMTLEALTEVNRPNANAFWKRFDSTHKIAWKTGTSFGHRDAWAIGSTPQYTVGVWVGHATGNGQRTMTGVKVAAPILFETFNMLKLDNSWFKKPKDQMKTVLLCRDDGFLANDLCQSRRYDIPVNSHFNRVTPYHLRIHLSKDTQERVHANCESVSQMQTKSWFVLPPDQAYYYQQTHVNYKPLPAWRADCLLLEDKQSSPISLVYPRRNTQIYIPRELAGKRGKTIFKAIHQNPSSTIYWHLDRQFIGTTKTFHEQALGMNAGKHTLTLVDEKGNRFVRTFQVISQ